MKARFLVVGAIVSAVALSAAAQSEQETPSLDRKSMSVENPDLRPSWVARLSGRFRFFLPTDGCWQDKQRIEALEVGPALDGGLLIELRGDRRDQTWHFPNPAEASQADANAPHNGLQSRGQFRDREWVVQQRQCVRGECGAWRMKTRLRFIDADTVSVLMDGGSHECFYRRSR